MNLAAALVITAVVWSVSLIRPVRLRALAYSLPVPMTAVLVTGDVRVDGSQLLGVVLLVGFFAVVALLHVRLGWHILLADAAAIAAYIVVAWALPPSVPLVPALLAVVALWLAGWLLPLPPREERQPPRTAILSAATAAKLAGVLAAALVVVGLGGLLAGLVVTFPYSGVLVAVEVRGQLVPFTRHFARTAIALAAFVAGYAACQDRGTVLALLAGWLAFGACAAALHLRPAGVPR
ncbi:MAG TPA: hypothetical protein VES42_25695 [Pilimelia sp.]|nr:hypothetical protein [Pilimelia sp.]